MLKLIPLFFIALAGLSLSLPVAADWDYDCEDDWEQLEYELENGQALLKKALKQLDARQYSQAEESLIDVRLVRIYPRGNFVDFHNHCHDKRKRPLPDFATAMDNDIAIKNTFNRSRCAEQVALAANIGSTKALAFYTSMIEQVTYKDYRRIKREFGRMKQLEKHLKQINRQCMEFATWDIIKTHTETPWAVLESHQSYRKAIEDEVYAAYDKRQAKEDAELQIKKDKIQPLSDALIAFLTEHQQTYAPRKFGNYKMPGETTLDPCIVGESPTRYADFKQYMQYYSPGYIQKPRSEPVYYTPTLKFSYPKLGRHKYIDGYSGPVFDLYYDDQEGVERRMVVFFKDTATRDKGYEKALALYNACMETFVF